MNRFLAATLLALLVPSAFAAGRELAPRPLIPTSGSFDSLSVASAGDLFLTVWRERHPRSEAIYGVLSGGDGRRLSPAASLLVESAQIRTIHLAGTGDSFAMFWTDDAKVVHLTNIDLDGGVIDTRATALPSAERLSVAWDGERFLAVLFRPTGYREGVVAALLDRDGTVVRGAIALGATPRRRRRTSPSPTTDSSSSRAAGAPSSPTSSPTTARSRSSSPATRRRTSSRHRSATTGCWSFRR